MQIASIIKNKYNKINENASNKFINKDLSNKNLKNIHNNQNKKEDDKKSCKIDSGKLNKNKKYHKGVLAKIEESINENNENLNNPDPFYNELFNNIMNKKQLFI